MANASIAHRKVYRTTTTGDTSVLPLAKKLRICPTRTRIASWPQARVVVVCRLCDGCEQLCRPAYTESYGSGSGKYCDGLLIDCPCRVSFGVHAADGWLLQCAAMALVRLVLASALMTSTAATDSAEQACIVISPLDFPDDGVPAASNATTLRDCINQANAGVRRVAASGPGSSPTISMYISFAPGVSNVAVAAPLPAITAPHVTIDGLTHLRDTVTINGTGLPSVIPAAQANVNPSCCPLRPRTTPFTEE